MWASTSDPFYALDGVRVGASAAVASARLHPKARLRVGQNTWYLARRANVTALVEVRHRGVQELAIAVNAVTADRRLQRALVKSLS